MFFCFNFGSTDFSVFCSDRLLQRWAVDQQVWFISFFSVCVLRSISNVKSPQSQCSHRTLMHHFLSFYYKRQMGKKRGDERGRGDNQLLLLWSVVKKHTTAIQAGKNKNNEEKQKQQKNYQEPSRSWWKLIRLAGGFLLVWDETTLVGLCPVGEF